MKTILTNQYTLKNIVCLLLVSQLGVTGSYYQTLFDTESERIELCDLSDTDSDTVLEDETDKNEKEEKITVDLLNNTLLFLVLSPNLKGLVVENCCSLFHPEVIAPPPELLDALFS